VNLVDSENHELGKQLEGSIVLCKILIGLSHLRETHDFKLITFIRSYEFASNFPTYVLWDQVDAIITINTYKTDLALRAGHERFKGLIKEKIHYIRNPFDVSKYSFKKRKHGYRVGQCAVISIKKGAGLLTEFAQQLRLHDPKYRIRIIGGFGDMRAANHIRYLHLKEPLLQDPHFRFFNYAEKDLAMKFVDMLDFCICTSVDEGDPNFIKEAMAMGVKPIIRAFPGAYEMFPPDLVSSNIPGMIEMIEGSRDNYESERYRQWVKDNNDPSIIMPQIQELVESV
jgi:glycosyltransferase involved in cell wall biosynthesis